MEEKWKDIPGFEGHYQASNYGRIKSKRKVLKPHVTHRSNRPRWQATLSKEGKTYHMCWSRCVYSAFYGPIPECMQVNHIDENPENNRLDNLNLMTPKENTNWGTGIQRRATTHSGRMKGKQLYEKNPKARPIMEYDKEGNELFLWYTIKAAAEYHKKDYTTIMYNLEGKSKSLRDGTYFRYYERKEAV